MIVVSIHHRESASPLNLPFSALLAANKAAIPHARAITSANSTTFTVGTAGSFTVTATGNPTARATRTSVGRGCRLGFIGYWLTGNASG